MLQNLFTDTVKFANSLLLFRLPHSSFLIPHRTLPAHLPPPISGIDATAHPNPPAPLSLFHMMDAVDLVAVDCHCKGEYLFLHTRDAAIFVSTFLYPWRPEHPLMDVSH